MMVSLEQLKSGLAQHLDKPVPPLDERSVAMIDRAMRGHHVLAANDAQPLSRDPVETEASGATGRWVMAGAVAAAACLAVWMLGSPPESLAQRDDRAIARRVSVPAPRRNTLVWTPPRAVEHPDAAAGQAPSPAESAETLEEPDVAVGHAAFGAAGQVTREGVKESSRRHAVRLSAEQLAARARAELAAGKIREAATMYEQLYRQHPRSTQAKTGLIVLGELYRRRLNQPRLAERAFARYLKASPSGALAVDARLGRIEALRALGRRGAEAKAIEAFLRAHPGSGRVGALRGRLDQLNRLEPAP